MLMRFDTITTGFFVLVIAVGSLYPFLHVPTFPGGDKTLHVAAYAVLVLPLAVRYPRYWVLVFSCASVFGMALEYLQQLTGRFFEWEDMLANACGAALGSIIGAWFGSTIFRQDEETNGPRN